MSLLELESLSLCSPKSHSESEKIQGFKKGRDATRGSASCELDGGLRSPGKSPELGSRIPVFRNSAEDFVADLVQDAGGGQHQFLENERIRLAYKQSP